METVRRTASSAGGDVTHRSQPVPGFPRTSRPSRTCLALFSLPVLLLSACDQNLDPFQATEMAYSIHGHLDAAADTQWIRVSNFRSSIFSTSDPLDVLATVENLETGETIELRPALFRRRSPNLNDTLYAYNYWSTERIDPATRYRLAARRSDGSMSQSDVLTPPPFHPDSLFTVGIRQGGLPNLLTFFVPPLAHVAMVQTWDYLKPADECPHFFYFNPLPQRPPLETGGRYQLQIRSPQTPLIQGCGPDRSEIRIVLSGEAWPFLGRNDYTNIGAYTNIENGVGFLGGVITRNLPYERDSCVTTGPGRPNVCDLHYGATTATLIAKPINGWGNPEDPPPFLPLVTLTREGNTWSRVGIPIASTDFRSPKLYRIPGLLPGRYTLHIGNPFGTELPLYCEERTFDIVPGDQTIEVTMVRLLAFPNEPVNANGCREG